MIKTGQTRGSPGLVSLREGVVAPALYFEPSVRSVIRGKNPLA
jgi:hypothetical protein